MHIPLIAQTLYEPMYSQTVDSEPGSFILDEGESNTCIQDQGVYHDAKGRWSNHHKRLKKIHGAVPFSSV